MLGGVTGAGSGGGGGLFSGLGGKPSAEAASRNVFGSTSFGSQPQQAATTGRHQELIHRMAMVLIS